MSFEEIEDRQASEELSDLLPASPEVRRLVERVAPTAAACLLVGETGVGKEFVATRIHHLSPRRAGPFVRVNCATLPEELLERELFGFERGAFPDAHEGKPGLIESADGGTVFLDEIGEMPLALQARILRVVEEGTFYRAGGTDPRRVDVRFLAATRRDLAAEAQRGTFRADLYYRLSLVTVCVPPLRERGSEIVPLARTFLAHAAGELGAKARTFSPEAEALLEGHTWPGNIRELRNVATRAALLCPDLVVRAAHLTLETSDLQRLTPARGAPIDLAAVRAAAANPDAPGSLRSDVERLRRAKIVATLEQTGNNQTLAAKALGISRSTLIARMEEYGLPRPRRRAGDTRSPAH